MIRARHFTALAAGSFGTVLPPRYATPRFAWSNSVVAYLRLIL